jgi:hypothetical protein
MSKDVFLNSKGCSNNRKKHLKCNYFCREIFSGELFRAALYMLMLVLNKDALVHYCDTKMTSYLNKSGPIL